MDPAKDIYKQDFFANLALALTTRLVLASLLGIRTILGPPNKPPPVAELAGEEKLGRCGQGGGVCEAITTR